ncbi:hypothetical protein Tco_0966282 [Tanacetum coccineum]
MKTLDIPHGLHRGRNFLESFGGHSNDPMLLLMEIPHTSHLEGKFFESCGCLLLVCRDDTGSNNLPIYKIMKGYSVWSVRYLVNIEQLMHPLPKGWSIRIRVWSICLGEREKDAFVVINISGKIKFEKIKTATPCRPSAIHPRDHEDHQDDDAYPERESSAKRHKTSELGTYSMGKSSSGHAMKQEQEPNMSGLGSVSQELLEEMSVEIDEDQPQKAIDKMLKQRCNSGEEHQYHLDQM